MKILLLTKPTDICKEVQSYVKRENSNTTIFEGDRGESFPMRNFKGNYDYIISFLSPWILSKEVLQQADNSINFHPGTPSYPGAAGYNLALYNGDKEYGVLSHHMDLEVDSGKIIRVDRFPTYSTDSVLTLKNRSMDHLVRLFYDVFCLVKSGSALPESNENWSRKPYTRKDLLELCRITPDMDQQEINRRIRATYFPGARDSPYIEIEGRRFVLKE
jgi:methionyl-tRNA formyltransferase